MNTSQKDQIIKKLKLLARYQKMEQILAKESDKMGEVRGKQKDQEEIAKIKQKLKK